MKKTTLLFGALVAATGYANAQAVPSNPKAIECSPSTPGPPYAWTLQQGAPGLLTIQVMNAGWGSPMPLSTFSVNLSVDSTKIPFDFSNGPVYDVTSNGGKWTIVSQSQSFIKLRNTNGTIAANEMAFFELKLRVPPNAPLSNAMAALNVQVTGGMSNLAQNTIATPQDDHMTASIPIVAAAPLHVRFASFSAVRQGSVALLEWSTAMEENNDHFEVERSSDGSNFLRIASVAGAGNSQSLKKYSLTDDKALNGINYYRIKQIDRDGKSLYSEVKKVNFSGNTELSIYPNPVSSVLTIDGLNGDEQIAIYNTVGQKMMEVTAKGSPADVSVGSLIPGNYTVVVLKNGQRISSKQFVKK
jgi:hypothetical protein